MFLAKLTVIHFFSESPLSSSLRFQCLKSRSLTIALRALQAFLVCFLSALQTVLFFMCCLPGPRSQLCLLRSVLDLICASLSFSGCSFSLHCPIWFSFEDSLSLSITATLGGSPKPYSPSSGHLVGRRRDHFPAGWGWQSGLPVVSTKAEELVSNKQEGVAVGFLGHPKRAASDHITA